MKTITLLFVATIGIIFFASCGPSAGEETATEKTKVDSVQAEQLIIVYTTTRYGFIKKAKYFISVLEVKNPTGETYTLCLEYPDNDSRNNNSSRCKRNMTTTTSPLHVEAWNKLSLACLYGNYAPESHEIDIIDGSNVRDNIMIWTDGTFYLKCLIVEDI